MTEGKTRPMTTSERILNFLADDQAENPTSWVAVHEITLMGASDCAISARLRELARDGRVESRMREGKRFKEWRYIG